MSTTDNSAKNGLGAQEVIGGLVLWAIIGAGIWWYWTDSGAKTDLAKGAAQPMHAKVASGSAQVPSVKVVSYVPGEIIIDVFALDRDRALDDAVKAAHSALVLSLEQSSRQRRPRVSWIKASIDYDGEGGQRGSFAVIWPKPTGANAKSIAGMTAYEAFGAADFEGANERAKIDIQAWCEAGGASAAPEFCRSSLASACAGYAYARFERQCRAAGFD
jgi:hypothetical protein